MDSKANGDNNLSDWARAPPPTGPLWLRIAKAFYDPEEKSFLGRTPRRWAIVVAFYGVFYAVLAVMFSLCMGGLFLTLDRDRPSYTMAASLIGTNPGVAFRPLPQWPGQVVKYDLDNSTHAEYYIQEMNDFAAAYSKEEWFLKQTECNAADNYGFPSSPCFYIKLNKIYDWKPEFYDGDAAQLPIDMPEDLVSYITALEPIKRQQIWISCEDEGNQTTVEYPWGRGLPGSFYPFRNQPGYCNPVIAVRLTAPHNTPVFVRCRTWAKNIVFSKSLKEPSGYTRVQLYIEDHLSSEVTTEAH